MNFNQKHLCIFLLSMMVQSRDTGVRGQPEPIDMTEFNPLIAELIRRAGRSIINLQTGVAHLNNYNNEFVSRANVALRVVQRAEANFGVITDNQRQTNIVTPAILRYNQAERDLRQNLGIFQTIVNNTAAFLLRFQNIAEANDPNLFSDEDESFYMVSVGNRLSRVLDDAASLSEEIQQSLQTWPGRIFPIYRRILP